MDTRFDIPVLLIIFNRPDFALKVLESIRMVQPKTIYIGADGPREGKEGEQDICTETREAVIKAIDWDCEVKTLFHTNNLGCGLAPSTAITWFFENEEKGIILEDDCVPEKSFFYYCKSLLEHYADDQKVMHISGFNDQDYIKRGNASYYFSYFPSGWGWASWSRAWKYHSLKPISVDLEFKKRLVQGPFYNQKKAAENWLKHMFYNLENAWDYQWDYAIWKQNGLCIAPNTSLVKNIGFDERSTHTNSYLKGYTDIKVGNIDEITHPKTFSTNAEADLYTISKRYYTPFMKRMYWKLKTKISAKV